MKKVILIATMALVLAGSLEARGGHSHYYYDGWFVPFIFGSMLGASISRQPVIYTTQPAVIYTNQPTVVTEDYYRVQNIQEEQAPVYEERWVYFEDCQCERKVLVNVQQ